ncbi:DUF2332 family protein, partial [Streptomyces fungicidicus]|uniref:DUF2332 family protein n=1 Tax=Streptomyces fungicidicus TaxID=68203 RepID=UPI0036947B23
MRVPSTERGRPARRCDVHDTRSPCPKPSAREFLTWVVRHWGQVSSLMLARMTQTNESARCATLLPVLAALPQPLALIEVGASAGLCLYPDRYRYRY